MGSCRVYPTIQQTFQAYDRSQPLACNADAIPNTLSKCHWDYVNYCLVCDVATRVRFTMNLLWLTPPQGYWLGSLIMKNQLGTRQGSPGGECGGADLTVFQSSPLVHLSAPPAIVLMDLVPGDKMWGVPCCIQGVRATLTNAMAGNGNVTVNFIMVEETV